jgi:hypothetical protein
VRQRPAQRSGRTRSGLTWVVVQVRSRVGLRPHGGELGWGKNGGATRGEKNQKEKMLGPTGEMGPRGKEAQESFEVENSFSISKSFYKL